MLVRIDVYALWRHSVALWAEVLTNRKVYGYMSAVEGKKVAIVGAGPGGLTLARLLQQNRVRVFFREAVSMVWRPLLSCPSNQHWDPKPNITLIGDAAHVMPPYAGEGVNMAMLDALVLSRLLLNQETSSAAIAKYEAEMFARMQHMMKDTIANAEMFYAPDAPDRVVALFRSFGGTEAVPPAAEA
jgi:2-polyprenyl-6-methoxyphenol hydroxylase-like FAD-dependent oxidoreductase